MELRELIDALVEGDALTARQWVDDARRAALAWSNVPEPRGLDRSALAIAAGVVEMLALRAQQAPPEWTTNVAPADRTIFLVRSARTMPRLRRLCEQEGPEPLRRRRILASPDFLTAA